MSAICDRIFLFLLTALLLGTPFAIGSTPPPAYSAMEVGIFALVTIWMTKVILVRREASGVRGNPSEVRSTEQRAGRTESGKSEARLTPNASPLTSGIVPFALFVGLVAFQLMPIPPALMRILSPHTYEFYTKIFYGWPLQPPYADLPTDVRREASGVRGGVGETGNLTAETQSTRREMSTGRNATNSTNSTNVIDTKKATPKSEVSEGALRLTPNASRGLTATWLPLTLAPYLTRIDLLKLIAYGALFFLILRYPYGASWERGNTEPSPLGNLSPDQRLLRWVVVTVLASGFLVAFVGFIQRFTWNGKILWFYEPWSRPLGGPGVIPRASGPFVNPDHFANYLALILPIALAFTLFRFSLANKDRQHTLRILAGGISFLIFTSILLSLSRGALVAVCGSIAVLAWLAPWSSGGKGKVKAKKQAEVEAQAQEATVDGRRSAVGEARALPLTPNALRGWLAHSFSIARAGVVVFCGLLVVALYFAGPSGREQVDARLNERFVDEVSLGGRSQIWRDSPKLIADFPILGVGLGSWPEVFMRYRNQPWTTDFFREAHNDYVQLVSEAGILGFALFAWFIFVHGRRLFGGLRNISSRYLPLIAAIIAALAGMALHEWFDFNLKIPANAFLFITLFALAVRAVTSPELRTRAVPAKEMLTTETQSAQRVEVAKDISDKAVIELRKNKLASLGVLRASVVKIFSRRPQRLSGESVRNSSVVKISLFRPLRTLRLCGEIIRPALPYAAIVIAIVLSVQALQQNPVPYPFNLAEAESLGEAKENVLFFPTNAAYHATLLSFLGDDPPIAWQLRELSAALWLEPFNPFYRDRYASLLLKIGKTDQALQEITRSIYNAPELGLHTYLDPAVLPKLPAEQQQAIEEGFRQSLTRKYPGSVDALAEVYARLGRFDEQAELYEWAAAQEKDRSKKVDFALRAGSAYASAKNFPKAEQILSDAISSNRSDPRPYQYLIRDIYGVKKDLLGAQQAVAEGLRNGASALDLNLALAEAARKADRPDEVATALTAARTAVTEAAKEQYPFDLYLQLADGAGRVGDNEQQLAALLAALELQPTDPDTLSRLANVYLGQKNYDRAVIYLDRLANIQYNSAEVYFRLAEAENARYRYATAGRAYARATELAPDNKNYKTAYEKFKENIANNLPKEKNREHAVGSDSGTALVQEASAGEHPLTIAKPKERRARR